ncbi:hypothetical protein M0802_014966 [Mischocyttarus mexicanus]|nr:hypothetical protein M0802_014966 [Mischocyttarus mexicanus]
MCFIVTATIHIVNNFDKKENIADLDYIPILCIIFHLVWIFIFCYIGQHLKNVSEDIFYKANGTSWYFFSKKSKTLLYFVIARASIPTYVSVGNMFIASHEFFSQLVKMSMSYAMVLHSRN